VALARCSWRRHKITEVKVRILIIGGTRILGRHLVEAAPRRHEVTLFNRGKSNPDLFPELETILGDREKM
jgi:2'-hydroxyisoflavone reductase